MKKNKCLYYLMENNWGHHRFSNQLNRLNEIIRVAKASENPSLSFYQSDARQVLFYLEALCRLYKNIHDEDLFKTLKEQFKSLEDQLGKIDYFENYQKELTVIVYFPRKIINHLQLRFQEEFIKLGDLLHNDAWLENRIADITAQLEKAKWLKPEQENKEIAKAIAKEIKEIEKDYTTGKINFNYLEEGVHEFRRQIRWISIYAQALDGVIQLKDDHYSELLSHYLSPEVLNSRFNVMPPAKAASSTINLSKNAFYALSWMIAKSGDLKDEGLKLICVEESMREINFKPEAEIKEAAKKMLPELKVYPKEIKLEMKTLADIFIKKDKVLDILRDDLKESYKD